LKVSDELIAIVPALGLPAGTNKFLYRLSVVFGVLVGPSFLFHFCFRVCLNCSAGQFYFDAGYRGENQEVE
jgi:hypothetical protein